MNKWPRLLALPTFFGCIKALPTTSSPKSSVLAVKESVRLGLKAEESFGTPKAPRSTLCTLKACLRFAFAFSKLPDGPPIVLIALYCYESPSLFERPRCVTAPFFPIVRGMLKRMGSIRRDELAAILYPAEACLRDSMLSWLSQSGCGGATIRLLPELLRESLFSTQAGILTGSISMYFTGSLA